MPWALLAAPLVLAVLVLGLAARRRLAAVRRDHQRCLRRLEAGDHGMHFDPTALDDLPAPVRRYLRHVLPAGTGLPTLTRIRQHGSLRTAVDSPRWLEFEADQVIAALAPGFHWLARVRIGAGLALEVCDRLVDGEAASEVRLFSMIRLGADRGSRQINEAALQRFLAEAAWSPAALLPAAGVAWHAIDDRRALASLARAGTRITLEFRFNAQDEIESVFAPARWMREQGRYRAVAWEGRYFDYAVCDGIRVPLRAEVGWYAGADWCAVWKGRVARIEQLPPAPARRRERAIHAARG